MSAVNVEPRDGVAIVRMTNGESNLMSRALVDDLRATSLRLSDQPPEAVILTGEGNFCGGVATTSDGLFEPMRALLTTRDAFRAQEVVQRNRTALESFSRLPCPVIAAIEGDCIGPGLALALCCDLRVASSAARLADDDIQRGLVSGFGALSQLAVRVGTSRALDIVLGGTELTADDALHAGLVHRVVDPGSAVDAALQWVVSILSAPAGARVQALMAMRALQHQLIQATGDIEGQAAARAWIRGEWTSR